MLLPTEPSPICQDKQPEKGITEEDKIQELLNRSDTAVIFPEPVSDHDDGPSNATTEDPDDDGKSIVLLEIKGRSNCWTRNSGVCVKDWVWIHISPSRQLGLPVRRTLVGHSGW